MNTRAFSIRRRIILGFSFFAIFISIVFGFYNFLFAYVIEDEFFERLLEDEALVISEVYRRTGKVAKPRLSFIQVYRNIDSLPEGVRTQLIKQPETKEYSEKNGRHYHIHVSAEQPELILLSEVSDYLVVRAIKNELLIVLIISSLVMLALASLFGYWLAGKTINPLSSLVNLIENTKPGRLPNSFAASFPNNEIGTLAKSLESAIAKIGEFIEREQHFTRDVSHELRSPITSIKGAVELLVQREISASQKLLVERIQTSLQQMEQVVETLLVLAREEFSNDRKSSVKVLSVVEKAIISHAHLIENKPVSVKVNVEAFQTLTTTPGILQILLTNLVGNAFQYTHKGQVTISLVKDVLVIEDNGEGIDVAIKEQVTLPLVRGKQGHGFGLGLSIVRRICEKQKFLLDIDSSESGTSVRVNFSPKFSNGQTS